MGTEVQASVRPSDARVFAPGHALARVDENETRGIASANGRIWSIRRSGLPGFIGWCETVAKQLAACKQPAGLPEIDFLARPIEIGRLDDRPLAVFLDDHVLRGDLRITVHDGATSYLGDVSPSIQIRDYSEKNGTLLCDFLFDSKQEPILLKYSARQKMIWQKSDTRNCMVRLDFGDEDRFEGDLDEFLEAFQPA